jgi:hypothetical protein
MTVGVFLSMTESILGAHGRAGISLHTLQHTKRGSDAMRSIEQWEMMARIERGLLAERAARAMRLGEPPTRPRAGRPWLWLALAWAPWMVRRRRAAAAATNRPVPTCPRLRRTPHAAMPYRRRLAAPRQ